jgi:hypothetical protein
LSGEKGVIYFCLGDGEGGIEMTGSMLLIREFCDRFVPAEKVTRTRIVRLSGHYCIYLHANYMNEF